MYNQPDKMYRLLLYMNYIQDYIVLLDRSLKLELNSLRDQKDKY
jgi:hypothetical protein